MNAAKDISVSRDAVADPDVREANARADKAPARKSPAPPPMSTTFPKCAARCMPRPFCLRLRTAGCWALTPRRP